MQHQRWLNSTRVLLVLGVSGLFCFVSVGRKQAAVAEGIVAAYQIDVQDNIVYGKGGDESLTLHLAKPRNARGRRPGLVCIHGGGWKAGDKNDVKGIMRTAARRGYVAVAVGYRFAPKHPFPAQIEDCKCAVRWLRHHADELDLDPKRIGAIGFSAGAHLSMLLGTMDSADGLEGNGGWNDESSKVQAVVSYFGPTDLTLDFDAIRQGPSADVFNEAAARSTLQAFVNGDIEQHRDTLRRASPIVYVDAGDAPMLLFQGTRDSLVPFDQAFRMAVALTKAKVPGRVELIVGVGHGWLGNELKRTQQTAFAFLDRYLVAQQQ